MNWRAIDRIWHVRGSLALASGMSSDEAFTRLDPLFHEYGTSHQRSGDTVVFHKKDQAAQDKMSVFDEGVLQVERSDGGMVLRYHLISRALLFCFLMPLLFLAIAQATVLVGKYQKRPAHEASKVAKKPKKAEIPMSAIDKALGAPAPDKKDKKKDEDKKPSPTSAYVFAGLFALLYVIGRILETWLIRSLFRKRLLTA